MLIKQSHLQTIKTLGIITLVLIVILFIFEIQAYYFPMGGWDNQTLINKLLKKEQRKTEDYINIYEDTEFNSIFDYLSEPDAGYEDKILNTEDSIGCYDNDRLIEDIKGPGNTCKTVAPDIFNIFEKNLLHPNGGVYSYADICPVTSGQERPIMCLYKKGNHINQVNKKMANLIDQVQLEQENRLGKLENSLNTHRIDPNRLYNLSHVKEFNNYEEELDMGIERKFTNEDQLDDLVLYSQRLKANLS